VTTGVGVAGGVEVAVTAGVVTGVVGRELGAVAPGDGDGAGGGVADTVALIEGVAVGFGGLGFCVCVPVGMAAGAVSVFSVGVAAGA
jgi:hypothetical protein